MTKASFFEYERHMASPLLTEEERNELRAIKDCEDEIEMRFGGNLAFGTAGLRATMGMGTARMNRLTVARTTRGLAHLVRLSGGESRGVAIACDSRNQSLFFAETAARVLASCGVKAYLFDDIRPTPELSFAIRHLGCMAGINITASHNPKEYNGYKAYWEDGAQISPEQAKTVSEAVDAYPILDDSFRMMTLKEAKEKGLVVMLGSETDDAYLEAVMTTVIDKDAFAAASDLRIVYTPLHGTGYRLVPEILRRAGLKNLYTVDSQMQPCGDFPTVKKPNPEYSDVFADGIAIAEREGSDLIIATDPDADRVGVMCRARDGGFVTLSGNQMGALLLDYVIAARREKGLLPKDAFAVKSIVSTDMAYRIASYNGIRLHDVLTGFKFIGEVIKSYEAEGKADCFIFGFEESYGYLFGSYARDKDAVGATLMIAEMTAYYREKDMTLADAMQALYDKYGTYREAMLDIYMEGIDGNERRRRLMEGLRKTPLTELGGTAVACIGDYLAGTVTDLVTGESRPTGMIASDVLYYTLASGDKIIFRPSGTEPKVKIYFLANGKSAEETDAKVETYKKEAEAIVSRIA